MTSGLLVQEATYSAERRSPRSSLIGDTYALDEFGVSSRNMVSSLRA